MAAVNDRVTRFVRDHDLPVIVFGYGDCTGGAQASFVTHPLVQTYYFSGTTMPFAGQIVVPSNLPLNSILSNYLSQDPGAMQGLVKHPFHPELDAALAHEQGHAPLEGEGRPGQSGDGIGGIEQAREPAVLGVPVLLPALLDHRPPLIRGDDLRGAVGRGAEHAQTAGVGNGRRQLRRARAAHTGKDNRVLDTKKIADTSS